MNFTIKEAKKAAAQILVPLFEMKGFKFIERDFLFKKTSHGTKVECMFFWYNFLPARIELSFTFIFSIKEIQEETKKFCAYMNIAYKENGFYISAGDLHPLYKRSQRKFRKAFTQSINNPSGIQAEVEHIAELLNNEFFPRLDLFDNLKKFQDFIFEDFHRVVYFGFIHHAFMAAKLAGKDRALTLAEYISNVMGKDQLNPIYLDNEAIPNFVAYVNLVE